LIYGQGVNAGVTTDGDLILASSRKAAAVPVESLKRGIELRLAATPAMQGYAVTLTAVDSEGKELGGLTATVAGEQLAGNLSLVNNHGGAGKPGAGKKAAGKKNEADLPAGPRFWFADWKIDGSKVE